MRRSKRQDQAGKFFERSPKGQTIELSISRHFLLQPQLYAQGKLLAHQSQLLSKRFLTASTFFSTF